MRKEKIEPLTISTKGKKSLAKPLLFRRLRKKRPQKWHIWSSNLLLSGTLISLILPMENLRSALTKATSNQIIDSAQVHQILEPP